MYQWCYLGRGVGVLRVALTLGEWPVAIPQLCCQFLHPPVFRLSPGRAFSRFRPLAGGRPVAGPPLSGSGPRDAPAPLPRRCADPLRARVCGARLFCPRVVHGCLLVTPCLCYILGNFLVLVTASGGVY